MFPNVTDMAILFASDRDTSSLRCLKRRNQSRTHATVRKVRNETAISYTTVPSQARTDDSFFFSFGYSAAHRPPTESYMRRGAESAAESARVPGADFPPVLHFALSPKRGRPIRHSRRWGIGSS